MEAREGVRDRMMITRVISFWYEGQDFGGSWSADNSHEEESSLEVEGGERERKRTWRDHAGTRKWPKEGEVESYQREDAGPRKEADLNGAQREGTTRKRRSVDLMTNKGQTEEISRPVT